MDLSVVIPLYNEADSLLELKAWIERSLQEFTYEIIFVDDGSIDGSWEVIRQLCSESVHGIRFRRNCGKYVIDIILKS